MSNICRKQPKNHPTSPKISKNIYIYLYFYGFALASSRRDQPTRRNARRETLTQKKLSTRRNARRETLTQEIKSDAFPCASPLVAPRPAMYSDPCSAPSSRISQGTKRLQHFFM